MAERLADLLRACTVRVTGGPMPGAGFFIAPGKVLTCVHVIGDKPGLRVTWERDGQDAVEFEVISEPVRLTGRGRAIAALEVGYPDIAVLNIAGPMTIHACGSMPQQRINDLPDAGTSGGQAARRQPEPTL